MTKFYFLILCLFSFGFLSAQEELSKEEKERRERNIQAGNPFAKFGYKAKVATLSKGKYLEVHDLDSIVTIGTTRWHVDKNKIVGDIVIDSLNPDARPIGDVAGRWISPDPLSEEFPSWSPYNFVENNPARLIDPTGLAPQENEWIPKVNDDGSTSYIAEKGDTAKTLSSQYGISLNQAEKITNTKSSESIKAGTEISGEKVKSVTGSDVLKLDLVSKEGKNDQKRFNQFLFATDHSYSKGKFDFLPSDYFENRMNASASPITGYGNINGVANLTSDGETVRVNFSLTLYNPNSASKWKTQFPISNYIDANKPGTNGTTNFYFYRITSSGTAVNGDGAKLWTTGNSDVVLDRFDRK